MLKSTEKSGKSARVGNPARIIWQPCALNKFPTSVSENIHQVQTNIISITDTIILFKFNVIIPVFVTGIVYICILTLHRDPPWENLKMGEN